MQNSEESYLSTGISQIETTKLLVKELDLSVEHITYNIKRYHVPVSLVLIYSEEEISDMLKKHMRLTDALKVVKIGKAYFNFVFLQFTEVQESYSFIKKVEHHELSKIEHLFYFDALPAKIYNCYNLINSYLFKILEEKDKAL